jgi:prepilin-type processing-associated H-X9-DG protein
MSQVPPGIAIERKIMSQTPSPNPMEMPPPVQTVPQPGKGLAVAALILGLVGLIPLLGLVPAIVGIVLGIVALAKKRPGKGMAVAGIVTGGLGLVMIPVWVIVAIVPAVNHALEITRRANCVANLKGMGTALALYTQEYNNEYPQNLDLLIKNGESPKLFKCPSSDVHREFDYFYLAPAKDAPATTFVACDFRNNHKGEVRNVLFMDGHASIMKEPAFQQALTNPENAAFAAALKKAEGP